MDLIFKVRSEVAYFNYQMGKLDHMINLLLALCSHREQPNLVEETTTQVFSNLNIPIPLWSSHLDDQPKDHDPCTIP
jgi:hypothetical protein